MFLINSLAVIAVIIGGAALVRLGWSLEETLQKIREGRYWFDVLFVVGPILIAVATFGAITTWGLAHLHFIH